MKNLKQYLLVIIAIILTIPLLNSCSSGEIKDDQLSSFMLGGIYFIDGYGGMNRVAEILITDEGRSTDKELVEGYKELLEFPFEPKQAADTQYYLREYWEITDKAALLEQMEALKNREHEYKAWDYARSVNIACNGYSAGYLTKEEVLAALKELLPLAQKNYDTWEAYYAGYNAGLKDWDAQSQQVISYGKLSEEILSHEKSIYSILPLNTVNK